MNDSVIFIVDGLLIIGVSVESNARRVRRKITKSAQNNKNRR